MSMRTSSNLVPAVADLPPVPVRGNSEPTLDLFARGADNAIWHRWWVAGKPWTCWESLRGELASGAGTASHAAGVLNIAALGSDNRIWQRSFVNSRRITGGWSNWANLGTRQFSSAPAAASWGSNHFEFFAKGTDDRIWHNWYRFGSREWSGWYAFDGGGFTSAPAAASFEPQRLNVFAKGSDDRIYNRHHLGGGSWSGWQALGDNTFASAPAAVSWGSSHLEVFARGVDNRIWHIWYRFGGGGWSGWHAFDGDVTFTEAPAAGTHAPETLNLFALGSDQRIWERHHLGSGQWSPWVAMGDRKFTSAPAAVSWSNR